MAKSAEVVTSAPGDDDSDDALMTNSTVRSTTSDFIVEFLGSLVPGGTFLLSLIPGLVLPIVAVLHGLFPDWQWQLPRVEGQFPSTISTILLLLLPGSALFLALSYIAGHLFCRQNPKRPDAASYKKLPHDDRRDGMSRAQTGVPGDVEFPYYHLKCYLKDRGLVYLANRVPWDPNAKKKNKSLERRCKHWINALKIRIALHSPGSLGTIARNEAHVRLSSTMWYVSRVLFWTSLFSISTYFLAVLVTHAFQTPHQVPIGPIFLAPLIVAVLSYVTQWAIERTLHYQRQREILFILETAHWLDATGRANGIFSGLQ